LQLNLNNSVAGTRRVTDMKTIHKGRYTAEYGVTGRGPLLVVTRTKGGGRYMEGAEATEWAEHIRSAIDKSEANALCRALLD